MRFTIFLLLMLLSLCLSLLFYFSLLASCSGHPPNTAIGWWIFPMSLIGGTIFMLLSYFFWKAARYRDPEILKKEAGLLPKKVLVYVVSFVISAVAFILLVFLMMEIEIMIKWNMPDWADNFYPVVFIALAVWIGIKTYKRLTRI